MKEFKKKILEFQKNNNLSNEECSKMLGVSLDLMNKINNDDQINELSREEKKRILTIIENKKSNSGKKIVKILDLLFRFVAMVMALVTLLLCINENVETKTLVVLLSIGLVCSSMTILPKIEK